MVLNIGKSDRPLLSSYTMLGNKPYFNTYNLAMSTSHEKNIIKHTKCSSFLSVPMTNASFIVLAFYLVLLWEMFKVTLLKPP